MALVPYKQDLQIVPVSPSEAADVALRPRPTAEDLRGRVQVFERRRRKTYEALLDYVFARVQAGAQAGAVQIICEVPSFLVGSPLYDVNYGTALTIAVLRKHGYCVRYVFPKMLYVSWSSSEMPPPPAPPAPVPPAVVDHALATGPGTPGFAPHQIVPPPPRRTINVNAMYKPSGKIALDLR